MDYEYTFDPPMVLNMTDGYDWYFTRIRDRGKTILAEYSKARSGLSDTSGTWHHRENIALIREGVWKYEAKRIADENRIKLYYKEGALF